MTDLNTFDALAKFLERTGNYRVLKKLVPRQWIESAGESQTRLGMFLDVETTGLNASTDEIIEIAVVPFRYSLDGRLLEIGEPFQQFQQPSRPISAGITRLTGIDDDMVAGQKINVQQLNALIEPANLVIAHNAAFDRPFAERLTSVFRHKAWGCSLAEIDWHEEGFAGAKLAYLAAGYGFFFDEHRATNDCLAAIEILARPLPKSGLTALAKLLESARAVTCRIWAVHAPIEVKDQLKQRRYRWNPGENGLPKAWYIDVPEALLEAELDFLRNEVFLYDAEPVITRLTAYERYSDRT